MSHVTTATCLCGRFSHTLTLETLAPHKGGQCHCYTCRSVTGNLFWTGFKFNPTREFVHNVREDLVRYDTSPATQRFFCGICGTHIINYTPDRDMWCLSGGVVDLSTDTGKLSWDHRYVADTVDGGLLNCFPTGRIYLQDIDGKAYEDLDEVLKILTAENAATAWSSSTDLDVSCHCGLVGFSISRPDNGGRWQGCLCTCRSCRLSFGQSIATFAGKISYSKITWRDGSIYDGSVAAGLIGYQSSDHARRDSCSRCGACVFYQSTNQPGLLDVAAGLLKSRDGALARSWLVWDEKVHFASESTEPVLVDCVTERLANLNQTVRS